MGGDAASVSSLIIVLLWIGYSLSRIAHALEADRKERAGPRMNPQQGE